MDIVKIQNSNLTHLIKFMMSQGLFHWMNKRVFMHLVNVFDMFSI